LKDHDVQVRKLAARRRAAVALCEIGDGAAVQRLALQAA
jgi:hypothetical protein